MLLPKIIWVLFATVGHITKADSPQATPDLWKTVIDKLDSEYESAITINENNLQCTNDLLTLINKNEVMPGYDNQQFFDSWKLTTPMDLWTLDHFKLVSDDMMCKLNRPNSTMVNRYCTYEIPEPKLNDGFLAAYCIPDSCNETDARMLGRIVHEIAGNQSQTTENEVLTCTKSVHEEYSQGFYVSIMITVLAIVLCLIATMRHCMAIIEQEKGPHATRDSNFTKAFIKIFSLQTNFTKLLHRNSHLSIDSLHFMKVFAMLLIILCHMYFLTQIFASNLEAYRSYRPYVFYQIFYNGVYLTGTFFTIAGILQTYVVLTKFRNHINLTVVNPIVNDKPKFSIVFWLCMIGNRYMRIVPLYLYSILLISYILPYFHDYPAWFPSDPLAQCPKEIWRHLLFLNNFKTLQLCMPWTWYLAVDFQLFLFFLPLVILFVYKPTIAMIVSTLCVLTATAVRVYLVLKDDFPPALMLMLPFPQYNLNFARYSFEIYMRPYSWAPSYIIGLMFGYAAYYIKGQRRIVPLKLPVRIVFWVFTLIFLSYAPFGVYWNAIGFKNIIYDGFYVALSPICWSLALGWIALHSKCYLHRYSMRWFFGLRVWLVLSKLTYGCYLIHLVVAFGLMYKYSLDKGGRPKVFLPYKDLYGLFACVTLVSYLGSLVLYLIVEGPASNLQNYLIEKCFYFFGRRSKQSIENFEVEGETEDDEKDSLKETEPLTDIQITVKLIEDEKQIIVDEPPQTVEQLKFEN